MAFWCKPWGIHSRKDQAHWILFNVTERCIQTHQRKSTVQLHAKQQRWNHRWPAGLPYWRTKKSICWWLTLLILKKDWNWIVQHNTAGVEMHNISEKQRCSPSRAPKPTKIIQSLTTMDVLNLKYYTLQKVYLRRGKCIDQCNRFIQVPVGWNIFWRQRWCCR